MHRADNNRLSRQILFSQLCKRKINEGNPRLRFKGSTKMNMKWKRINHNKQQTQAKN